MRKWVLLLSENDSIGQFDVYLKPTQFLDCEDPSVVDYTHEISGGNTSEAAKIQSLFYSIRDSVRYDPYRIDFRPDAMKASATLSRGYGFCITKAILLAAAARVLRIPSRLGFADVKNHLNTKKLKELMQTDIFAFHGYAELHIDGKWVKATPAFNASLCERFNVAPLEFDGSHDALLQQCDRSGNQYMEYVNDHGLFADLPFDMMITAFKKHYPHLMNGEGGYTVEGRFEDDGSEQIDR